MKRLRKLVTFSLDDWKFALFLSAVIRIIRVVEITSLPKAPDIVLGVINMHSLIIPVFDIHKRFRLSGTGRFAGPDRRPSKNGDAYQIMERRVFYREGRLTPSPSFLTLDKLIPNLKEWHITTLIAGNFGGDERIVVNEEAKHAVKIFLNRRSSHD